MEDLKFVLAYITHRELAVRLGITKSNPHYWLKTGEVPERHLEALKTIKNELALQMKERLKKMGGKK